MPTIQCEQYTCESKTQEHHDCDKAERKSHKMHQIIRDICIEILTETDFEELMKNELSNTHVSGHQSTFDGRLILDDVLRLKKKKLNAICSYLFTVDKEKSTGIIGLCYLFSCYEDSTNSRTTNVINNGDVSLHPLKIGGFKIDVNLPMINGVIDNPLHSARLVDYLCDFWMSRPSLWSRAIISLWEEAYDKKFFGNNQGVEGVISQEKNQRSTFKEDTSSLSALMLRRWDDSFNGSRLAFGYEPNKDI